MAELWHEEQLVQGREGGLWQPQLSLSPQQLLGCQMLWFEWVNHSCSPESAALHPPVSAVHC